MRNGSIKNCNRPKHHHKSYYFLISDRLWKDKGSTILYTFTKERLYEQHDGRGREMGGETFLVRGCTSFHSGSIVWHGKV